MAGKSTTPLEVTEALAFREAGYTVLAISQRLGISTRTVQRHLTTHGAKKGKLMDEMVSRARDDLMKRITSDDSIREEAAMLVNDDLAHARHLRAILVDASEHLRASSLGEAVLVMRSAAAYSTALKNTADTLRRAMRLDQLPVERADNLPELVVRELTHAEVKALRDSEGDGVTDTATEIVDDVVLSHS